MVSHRYRGFDGVELVADIYGDEEAPAVLLLHGGGQTRAVWTEVATALAEAGRHVICPDLRGHGESGRPADGRYGLDAYAGDLRAMLETLGSRPVVVAASLGGWIATAVLGEGGEHLATGLVLVDAPPRMDAVQSQRVSGALRRHAEQDAALDWDPRILGGIDMAAIEPRLAAAACGIKVPTLVVRGERSPLSTVDAVRELAQTIPGAEYAEVADAGHLVAVDQSDAFSALLLEFLERRVPRNPPEYRAGSDPRTLRDALGCFGTGVTVVTTLDASTRPVGLTANSFTSVSLDPPLLLVCLAKSAGSLPAFEASGVFAVNVLHTGQQTVSGRFASRQEDRFAATPWEAWDTGAPIVSRSLASFDCEKHAWHDAGDHVILVGLVRRVRFEPRRDPLLYFRGRYRRLHFN